MASVQIELPADRDPAHHSVSGQDRRQGFHWLCKGGRQAVGALLNQDWIQAWNTIPTSLLRIKDLLHV